MLFKVSYDGYVRCTIAELRAVGLTHHFSGLDEEDNSRGVMSTDINGYTEWVDKESALITIGWDWQMKARNNSVELIRDSDVRSNLMLVNSDRRDLSAQMTVNALALFIDNFDWCAEVLHYIKIRYS